MMPTAHRVARSVVSGPALSSARSQHRTGATGSSLRSFSSVAAPKPRRAAPVRASRLQAQAVCTDGDCLPDEDGTTLVRDDLDALLQMLPKDIRDPLAAHPERNTLLEVVLDLGRKPQARFLAGGHDGIETLREEVITAEDLESAVAAVGEFGDDNRAGITSTLHRISAIRNRKGRIVGLTCRVGRAVTGHVDMIRDILEVPNSILFLGSPGVGKTTVIREMARVLADDLHKRVVIIDTSNEIGGDGDIPHPAIGGARRLQVANTSLQHRTMIEAVENHMPEIVIVDEIGTEAEALACRTIAERGVQLVATAHGQFLDNLIKNPTLCDLVGGVETVTLGDDEAKMRGTQKSVLERRGPPTFPLVIEIRERALWVCHWVEDSVDQLLMGRSPQVQVRNRDAASKEVIPRVLDYKDTLREDFGSRSDSEIAPLASVSKPIASQAPAEPPLPELLDSLDEAESPEDYFLAMSRIEEAAAAEAALQAQDWDYSAHSTSLAGSSDAASSSADGWSDASDLDALDLMSKAGWLNNDGDAQGPRKSGKSRQG